MTPPQPSRKARLMTLKLVPGGPEPITKGLGNVRPSTVVESVGIKVWQNSRTATQVRPWRQKLPCASEHFRQVFPGKENPRMTYSRLQNRIRTTKTRSRDAYPGVRGATTCAHGLVRAEGNEREGRDKGAHGLMGDSFFGLSSMASVLRNSIKTD